VYNTAVCVYVLQVTRCWSVQYRCMYVCVIGDQVLECAIQVYVCMCYR